MNDVAWLNNTNLSAKKNNDEELKSIGTPLPFTKKGKGGYFIWAKPKGGRSFSTGIKFDTEIGAAKFLKIIFASYENYQKWEELIGLTNSTWNRQRKEKVNTLIEEFESSHTIFDKFRKAVGNELADILVFELGVEQYSILILNHFKRTEI